MASVLWVGGGRWPPEGLEGHEVHRARDAREALAVLEGLIFDVVVLPAGLPVAEQLAVCAALRADAVHGRTRVVGWAEAVAGGPVRREGEPAPAGMMPRRSAHRPRGGSRDHDARVGNG